MTLNSDEFAHLVDETYLIVSLLAHRSYMTFKVEHSIKGDTKISYSVTWGNPGVTDVQGCYVVCCQGWSSDNQLLCCVNVELKEV